MFSINKISTFMLVVYVNNVSKALRCHIPLIFSQSMRSSTAKSSSSYADMTINVSGVQSNDKILTALDKPRVLFVLGGPGAGKGTQCAKLSEEFEMTHLSAGELLRKERASGSSDGNLIESYLKDGKIVPVKITLDLLRKAMETQASHRFLVDGFPRNWDNVQGWEQYMSDVCVLESVIFIDCPEEELERRLMIRGQTSGRSDDNVASAKKRFLTFRQETMPIVSYFEGKGLLQRVNGDLPVEAVYNELKNAVDPFLKYDILNRTQALLNAISERDWPTYSCLCHKSMTAFEAEAKGQLVKGLEFHKFYFDVDTKVGGSVARSQSVMSQPEVRIMGKTAVVSYVRVMQLKYNDGTSESRTQDETRVWQLIDGAWRNVHLHRSNF